MGTAADAIGQVGGIGEIDVRVGLLAGGGGFYFGPGKGAALRGGIEFGVGFAQGALAGDAIGFARGGGKKFEATGRFLDALLVGALFEAGIDGLAER
jgi:hypothetical protein